MPRGRRQLSRKGCFSCKKLKIKCDEARPSCEYCSHTGRQCVYRDQSVDSKIVNLSDRNEKALEQTGFMKKSVTRKELPNVFLAHVNTSLASTPDSWEASINGHDFDADFDKIRENSHEEAARHVLSPRPYNSASTQLHMTRFELRLLRFFHDQCIPYITFNANKKTDHIWRNVFPRYFASSDLVRQSTYAMACLNLWPVTNLPTILASDNSKCTFHISPLETSQRKNPFQHVFDDLSVFDNNRESIFSLTTSYFLSTLQASQTYVGETRQKSLTCDDLATLSFSSSMIFAYAGVHPHCVLPLIDHDSEYPADFIGFFASMRKVFLTSAPGLREQFIDTLMEYSFLTPTAASEKIGFVEVFRAQLQAYYFANTKFSEIGAKICAENDILQKTLVLLECSYLAALREGHPTPLFKFLALLDENFIDLARARNLFALRILFAFSCICLYCQFYLSFDENVWMQFINGFLRDFTPLCSSDAALYDYVITKRHFADPNQFTRDIRSLSRVAFEFGGLKTPSVACSVEC
ncbi:hypothetical protein OY671_006703 [Metschnikowia pulcherrima]|nr:hypothetical protein OY671_006703 [Metschnikowia pulcherrima]